MIKVWSVFIIAPYAEPDVDLLDLIHLSFGVKRVAELESGLKGLACILPAKSRKVVKTPDARLDAPRPHLLSLQHFDHPDCAFQLWHLLFQPVPPREAV